MGCLSYIPTPIDIKKKKSYNVPPKNTDQQCFEWAISTKHVQFKDESPVYCFCYSMCAMLTHVKFKEKVRLNRPFYPTYSFS